jgi:3-hydroxy-9,10-secoandrosta-1,3,5(10)-triene-9,17-dione monooxygenase reductase component
MSIDELDFRRVLGQFATGVTVVTTRDAQGRPFGLTVNAFCSVSLEPPLVLVCIDRRSEAHPGFSQTGAFNVSVLAEGQEEISRRFAGRRKPKFEGIDLPPGSNGVPLVDGALAFMECRVVGAHAAGDHTIYLGEVLRLGSREGRPLVYHGSAYRKLDPDAQRPAS